MFGFFVGVGVGRVTRVGSGRVGMSGLGFWWGVMMVVFWQVDMVYLYINKAEE